jgi:GTP pyrophosphokinase
LVRLAQCCCPIPGDPIVGFVTRGRGIVVHRRDCEHAELFAADPERSIEVTWDSRVTNTYIVLLEVQAQDRPGLLHDVSDVFVNFGANVLEAQLNTIEAHADGSFKLQIQNRNQLHQIVSRLEKLQGVDKVRRAQELSSTAAGVTPATREGAA